MPLSQRFLSYLAFTMFVLMWLGVIAQSPGGMTAFAEEIVTVEQELVPWPPPSTPPTTPPDGQAQPQFETYPGGIVCQEHVDAQGETKTSCETPMMIFPY